MGKACRCSDGPFQLDRKDFGEAVGEVDEEVGEEAARYGAQLREGGGA